MAGKRGFPDWNKPFTFQFTRLEDSDLELAARLYPPLSQFVVGQVLYWDSFEAATISWGIGGSLVGGGSVAHALQTGKAYHGNQSLKITCNSNDGARGGAIRYFRVPSAPRLGLGVFFNPIDVTDSFYLRLQAAWSGVAYEFNCLWNLDNGAVQYKDSAGVYQTLDTVAPTNTTQPNWHLGQMVVDLETGQYVRLILGSEQYDIVEDGESVSSIGHMDYIVPEFGFELNGTVNHSWYFDWVILTRNEA